MAEPLARLSKEQVIQMAHRLRSHKRNAEGKVTAILTGLGTTVLSTASGGLMGYWMGSAEYEYNQNKAAIDAGDEPDPRQWFGVDKDLLISFLIAVVGLIPQLKGAGPWVQAFGKGGLAGWAWGAAREAALKSAGEEEDEEGA